MLFESFEKDVVTTDHINKASYIAAGEIVKDAKEATNTTAATA